MKDEFQVNNFLATMFIVSITMCFIELRIGLVMILIISIIGNIQRCIYNRKRKKQDIVKPVVEDEVAEPVVPPVNYELQHIESQEKLDKCFALERTDGGDIIVFRQNLSDGKPLRFTHVLDRYHWLATSPEEAIVAENGVLLGWTNGEEKSYIRADHRGIYKWGGLSVEEINIGAVFVCEDRSMTLEEFRSRKLEEEERRIIATKLKERQRKRELEKQVRQELIDSGELFGDEAKRPPIPVDVRDAVYRRDGGKCVNCGATQNLQYDHIIPFSKGGATSIENLQILCQKCNLEKSNKIG